MASWLQQLFLACLDIIKQQNRIRGDASPQGDSGYRLSSARERCHAARGTPRRTPTCRRPWGWCIPPATTNRAKPMSNQAIRHQPSTRTETILTRTEKTEHGWREQPRGGAHLDLAKRDEQALLELGVEVEQPRGAPEVAAGGGERVHGGGTSSGVQGGEGKITAQERPAGGKGPPL